MLRKYGIYSLKLYKWTRFTQATRYPSSSRSSCFSLDTPTIFCGICFTPFSPSKSTGRIFLWLRLNHLTQIVSQAEIMISIAQWQKWLLYKEVATLTSNNLSNSDSKIFSVKLASHTYALQQFDKFWIWRGRILLQFGKKTSLP